MKKCPVFLLFFLGATAMAAGPGLGCKTAGGEIETLLCSDNALAAKDELLSEVFSASLMSMEPAQRKHVRASQHKWLQGSSVCLNDPAPKDCLMRRYDERISMLQIEGRLVKASALVRYDCGAAGLLEISFYNNTPVPAAVLLRDSPQREIALLQISASGAKYVGRTFTFWSKNDSGLFSDAGKLDVQCEKR
jgi:uncharacterized protein